MTTPARPSRRSPSQERSSLFEYATLLEFSSVINSSHHLRFILNHILLTIMGRILASRGMAALVHGGTTVRVELAKGFPDPWEGVELDLPSLPREILEADAIRKGRSPWIRELRRA